MSLTASSHGAVDLFTNSVLPAKFFCCCLVNNERIEIRRSLIFKPTPLSNFDVERIEVFISTNHHGHQTLFHTFFSLNFKHILCLDSAREISAASYFGDSIDLSNCFNKSIHVQCLTSI